MAVEESISENKKALYWIPRYIESIRSIGEFLCNKKTFQISSVKLVYLLVWIESYSVSSVSLIRKVGQFHSESFFFEANKVFRDRNENAKYAFYALDLLLANKALQYEGGMFSISSESDLFKGARREMTDRYPLSDMFEYILKMSDKQFLREVISRDPY